MSTATSTDHMPCVIKLCRLCGDYIGNHSFTVTTITIRIDRAFFTEVGEDRTDSHPSNICMKCYTVMRHIEKRGTTSSIFNLSHWPPTY